MAARSVLVDTGPLVALFDPDDAHHERCLKHLAALSGYELWTTEAVVTEVMHLLSFSIRAQLAFQKLLTLGRLQVHQVNQEDRPALATLLERYHNVPCDYADATLVWLAKEKDTVKVFTLDSDFRIYRAGNKAFSISL